MHRWSQALNRFALARVALVAMTVMAAAGAGRAEAQGFPDSNFRLDLYTGRIIGSGRMVGLGGAYTAIATGIDGATLNPAGYAERAEQEIDWFEWELSGGVWLGGLFGNFDIENSGKNSLSYEGSLQLTGGARAQLANFGMGSNLRRQTFELRDPASGKLIVDVKILTSRVGGAYAFRDWVVGASVIFGRVGMFDPGSERKKLVKLRGPGGEVGLLYRPEGERYRLGLTARSAIRQDVSQDADGTTTLEVAGAEDLVLPKEVVIPLEVATGFAYQWGERRANPVWEDTTSIRRRLKRRIKEGTYEPPPQLWGARYQPLPEDPDEALRVALANDREFRKRFRHAQPRRYILLSTDAVFIGRVEDGQGLGAFLTQEPQTSGERISFSLRMGIESEVLADLLRVRAGSYLEPSRFAESNYRPHFTFGGDVHLFDLWDWSFKGTAAIDLAPRYFDWGLVVGLWY